jgi:hypothetical protein
LFLFLLLLLLFLLVLAHFFCLYWLGCNGFCGKTDIVGTTAAIYSCAKGFKPKQEQT